MFHMGGYFLCWDISHDEKCVETRCNTTPPSQRIPSQKCYADAKGRSTERQQDGSSRGVDPLAQLEDAAKRGRHSLRYLILLRQNGVRHATPTYRAKALVLRPFKLVVGSIGFYLAPAALSVANDGGQLEALGRLAATGAHLSLLLPSEILLAKPLKSLHQNHERTRATGRGAKQSMCSAFFGVYRFAMS